MKETVYRRIVKDRKQGGTLWTHLRVVTKKYRKRYAAYDRRGRLAGKRPSSRGGGPRLMLDRPRRWLGTPKLGHFAANRISHSLDFTDSHIDVGRHPDAANTRIASYVHHRLYENVVLFTQRLLKLC